MFRTLLKRIGAVVYFILFNRYFCSHRRQIGQNSQKQNMQSWRMIPAALYYMDFHNVKFA